MTLTKQDVTDSFSRDILTDPTDQQENQELWSQYLIGLLQANQITPQQYRDWE